MIYTFYSYKGGVGRSMALANIAKWFYLHGLRVVIIDWDLEAPGLENFFFDSGEPSTREQIQRVQERPGLIDLLVRYKRRFSALPIPSWPKVLTKVLEEKLPTSLPGPLAHMDIKPSLKALERALPSTLRLAFDKVDTGAALSALGQILPVTLTGSFGEGKTEEALRVLRESLPPVLSLPFERADAKALLKAVEESLRATTFSTAEQVTGRARLEEPNAGTLLKMLDDNLPATLSVSFDKAYVKALLGELARSLPETLPLATERRDDERREERKPEGINTESLLKTLEEVLPPDFTFLLIRAYAEALLGTMEENLPSFSSMLYPIYEAAPTENSRSAPRETAADSEYLPRLSLLSAGWRFGDKFPSYAQDVQSFDWTDFYHSFEGEAYFEWMRNQLNGLADVVLIDSRTGVTEMGGVCTRQLADVVVSLVAPNGQNLNGVTTMVESFRRKEVMQARRKWEDISTAVNGPVETIVIPARVETSEVEERNKFKKRFRDQLDKPPAAFQKVNTTFWDLKIPYISYYAYNEKLVIGMDVGGKGRSEELEEAYKDLGRHLAMLAPEGGIIRKRFAKELSEAFPHAMPGLVLVAYAQGQGDTAKELCGRLEDAGISLWEDPVAVEDESGEGRQFGGAVDHSESVVIVASPEPATSRAVVRAWRYARQQGKCVYLIGESLAGPGNLPGAGRLPKSAEVFDIASDWRRLAGRLQSPCQASRLPSMAPPIPEKFVGRIAELKMMKEVLLREAGISQRPSGVDLTLCGMGGSGKSALVAAFCQDEDVLQYFDGGILWATLGGNPDVLGELTKLYVALTGEKPAFEDVDTAALKVAERLSSQNCLMVIDDVWDSKDLKPFVRAGAYSRLIITTRDRRLAGESSATVIQLETMNTGEAVEILTSQLKASPHDIETQGQLAALVQRLGNSPLAVDLIGAELRRRVEQGDRITNAIEFLNQALDVQGVVAFDKPGTEDRRLSVAKTIALSLDQLTNDERTRYAQLAELGEGEEIPLEAISRKWGMDAFRTELTVQRLSYLSLLGFDPEGKTVRLHPLLRSYLIDQALLPSVGGGGSGPRNGRENAKKARQILQGASGGTPDELFRLAMQLKGEKRFGLARRILIRARKDSRLNEDKNLLLRIIQQLSLCTRKDPDLPLDERLALSFEILKETNEDLSTARNRETLGLAGAIFKTWWEVDGQKQRLERSLAYYQRGYRDGDKEDYGYTGINAAYVLDLLANQEMKEAIQAGSSSESAKTRRQEAKLIREEIVARLPPLAKQSNKEWLAKEWWFLVTLAEAFFGLRRYDEALYWLKEAAALQKIPSWEYEATARQLASIARLQDENPAAEMGEEVTKSRAWEVLRVFLRNDADALRSAFVGRVGLSLSGGGFRASLFHIGVLAKLAELDMLRNVEVLSCVSGGSIIGAHYYLEVRELLQNKPDSEITRQDYIEIVRRLEKDFLAGVQRNLRTRVMAEVVTNLKMIFWPNYSRTERVGELYEREIFSRVERQESKSPLYLNELRIQPADGPSDFSPRSDNWRRAAKVPGLILNATSLNTGHNWQFTASWMGEPPYGINTEIDGNDRLRRMYYHQAPKPHNRIRLGHAVAASACVPGLFEPLALSGLYPERVVRLVDGGVHDNQGVAGLLGEDCAVLLVSDASGQMGALKNPTSGLLGVPLRSNSILQARVREAEYNELEARRRSSLIRGLMFIHLKKGLEVDPVDWVGCDDPYEADDEAHTAGRRGPVTPYGVRKDVQQSLSAIRTDLDSFSDKEAYALMLSGYRMAGREFTECVKGFPPPPNDRPEWRFLSIEKPMDRARGFEDAHRELMRVLNVGSARAFKVWKLSSLLPVALVLGVIVLLTGILFVYRAWESLRNCLLFIKGLVWKFIGSAADLVVWLAEAIFTAVLTPLGAVAATAIIIAVLIFGGKIIQLIRRYKPISNIAVSVLMASVGWLGARIHLHLFDKLYLRQGRVEVQGEPALLEKKEPDPA
jgi:predicted acylesterase/phospholipase RssA/MinD-like ATPase involved in chromosome partitioning or flagellar assembly